MLLCKPPLPLPTLSTLLLWGVLDGLGLVVLGLTGCVCVWLRMETLESVYTAIVIGDLPL